MTVKDLKSAYKNILADHFPGRIEIAFVDGDKRQTLVYEKATWEIADKRQGLRYGENPGQEAALYRLINGNLCLGEVEFIQPGKPLVSDVELLQSGKHPGKINITDCDSALNILKHFSEQPCAVIVKHNNPCGVAIADSLPQAYDRANMADRIAAFGGAIALNRAVDKKTAELIAGNYAEVVVAPEFEEGVMDILAKRKNLRIMKIANMSNLQDYQAERFVDWKALMDGGLVAQWSYMSAIRSKKDLIPAQAFYKGKEYRVNRLPDEKEYADLMFGWLVETGITSNSVIYVKDGVTVGIGTGEQDRVGVAEIARDKAYRKLADRLCWVQHRKPYTALADDSARIEIDQEVKRQKGGLGGSCMISDAFFPFRDGVDVGIEAGVSAILQPGGSMRDFESIEACNEAGVSMVYTGERCFKH